MRTVTSPIEQLSTVRTTAVNVTETLTARGSGSSFFATRPPRVSSLDDARHERDGHQGHKQKRSAQPTHDAALFDHKRHQLIGLRTRPLAGVDLVITFAVGA